MPRTLRLLLVTCLILLAPVATAWAPLGHALVGEIAQRHLDPKAQAEVAALLAGERHPTLTGIASWADELRYTDADRFKATSRWHYINAKDGGCDFDLARDCPNGNCIVSAVQKQVAILGDRSQSLEARRDALKFVVHLVGDEHQPMHSGSHNDSGGNRFQISLRTTVAPEAYARERYVNGVMGTNLHSVWDYYLLASRGLALQDYANALDAQPKLATAPSPYLIGAPMDWTEESCRLINASGIYPPDNKHSMDHVYLDNMRPLAEQRVRLAGERLAQLLNQTIGKQATARAIAH